MYIYIHTYTYIMIHVYVYIYILHISIYMYTYIYEHIRTGHTVGGFSFLKFILAYKFVPHFTAEDEDYGNESQGNSL